MTHLFPVDATFYIDNPSVIRRPVDAEKTVSISVCNVKPTLVAFLLFLTTFPPSLLSAGIDVLIASSSLSPLSVALSFFRSFLTGNLVVDEGIFADVAIARFYVGDFGVQSGLLFHLDVHRLLTLWSEPLLRWW